MSPQIATSRPSIRPLRRRIVSASSSAWVGCSWLPSPALITAQLTWRAEQRHRAAVGVARDQHVRMHRVQRHRGVDQGLALLDRGRADRHVDDVGAEPLAGELERGPGARRALVEQVDLGQAAHQGELLVGLAAVGDVGVGAVQQVLDLPGRQPLDAEQMALAEGPGKLGEGDHGGATMGRSRSACKRPRESAALAASR